LEITKTLVGRLNPHIGKSASNKLPKDSSAVTGFYTKEEAEKWIDEYNNPTHKAMEKLDLRSIYESVV